MTLRMLLSLHLQAEWRHKRQHGLSAMDFRVAARAKRDYPPKGRPAQYPMVDDDGAFIPARGVTDTAAMAVALQNRLSQTSTMLGVLPLQRVTGRTHAKASTLLSPQGQYMTR